MRAYATVSRVVTYQTSDPRDGTVDICPRCRVQLEARDQWPRGLVTGEPYHSVYLGLHHGTCHVHVVVQATAWSDEDLERIEHAIHDNGSYDAGTAERAAELANRLNARGFNASITSYGFGSRTVVIPTPELLP